jgi:hypothetical protein
LAPAWIHAEIGKAYNVSVLDAETWSIVASVGTVSLGGDPEAREADCGVGRHTFLQLFDEMVNDLLQLDGVNSEEGLEFLDLPRDILGRNGRSWSRWLANYIVRLVSAWGRLGRVPLLDGGSDCAVMSAMWE